MTRFAITCFFLTAITVASAVDFAAEVQPILSRHCVKCHGGVRRKSDVSFLSRESVLSKGKSGRRVVVAGDPGASEMLRRVMTEEMSERMPPEGDRLSSREVEALTAWVKGGADWPRHWAFEPVRSEFSVAVAGLEGNPIDQFIEASLHGVKGNLSPKAEKHELIRRLYLDLVGLAPPVEEVKAFVAADDKGGDAYGKLVDRLLASPHFGERWGRHWLDQARYADSDGYEKDRSRPDAWRWRDWVIEAFNRDMPFDQFTVEQIAGDLLPDATAEQRLASAFHLQTLLNTEGGVDPEEDRTKRVIDRVNTTATVWLGVTAGCTQCHDHPYDPFTQKEFYGFYAFFNNADEAKVDVLKKSRRGPDPKREALESRLEEAEHAVKMSVRVLAERSKDRRETYRFQRGDFLQPDKEGGGVSPHMPSVLHPLPPKEGKASRLDLAKWLISPENPMTARVRVNKIWSHLFGAGLVRTMDDFGTRGEPPSHPELLDWLARTYRETGWSRKQMIRLIVSSKTYKQSSARREEMVAIDPDNVLLHRQNRLRAEAEIVRDLHLGVSGLLSSKVGGPSVYPPIPADVAALSYANSFKWETSKGEDRYRRGLYTFFKRTAPDPNLMIFDCPDANVTKTERSRSNTPIQALATLQNTVYVEAAQAMAGRLLAVELGTDGERIDHLFEICLARRPLLEERGRLLALLNESRQWYQEHGEDAAKLAGKHGGVDTVETAAWVATVRVVLNLDEFMTRG